MNRVPVKECEDFLATQNIPRVPSHSDSNIERIGIWKIALEEASKVNGMYCEFGSGIFCTPTIASMIPDKIYYAFDSFEGFKYEDFSDMHKKGTWAGEQSIGEKLGGEIAEKRVKSIPNVKIIKRR